MACLVEIRVWDGELRTPIVSPQNLPLGPKSLCEVGEFYRSRAFDVRIHRLDAFHSISRPHGGLRSSSWALWARNMAYAGRESIKTIPHGSKYRAIHVTDVTFEFEFEFIVSTLLFDFSAARRPPVLILCSLSS